MSQLKTDEKIGGAIGKNKLLLPILIPYAVATFIGCVIACMTYFETASLVLFLEGLADVPPFSSPVCRWATSLIAVTLPTLCFASVLISAKTWGDKLFFKLAFLAFLAVMVAIRLLLIHSANLFSNSDPVFFNFWLGGVSTVEFSVLNAFLIVYLMACATRLAPCSEVPK